MIHLESIYRDAGEGFVIRDPDQSLCKYQSFTRQLRTPCGTQTPDAALLSREFRAELTAILFTLPRGERDLINKHFGLNGAAPQSLAEIARARDITRQALHKTLSKSLRRLREMIKWKEQ